MMLTRLSLSVVCVLGFTHTHGAEYRTELTTPELLLLPHFTGCRSRDLETFRCWWSSGSLSNLSASLSVFFHMSKIHPGQWRECPDYPPSGYQCYFNKNFTHIWTPYCLQLRSVFNITYDETCFTVEGIVHPDPPAGLNWTLLNVSSSGLNFDVLVSWAPPLSADVRMGWMNLKYEVQYRIRNSSHWNKLDLVGGTQHSLYGLNPHRQYELRVRSKMSAFQNFGEFSDSIFIQISPTSTSESSFSTRLLLIACVVGLLIFLILILLSQQQRLMVILLAPVPAPKIKGIDPELLKRGKLEQLNSLLSTQQIFKPDSYPDVSWLEFIPVDLDDKHDDSDTRHLLDHARHSSLGCLSSAHRGDDDSGLELEPEREERHPLVSESDSVPIREVLPDVAWTSMDFYAQVSDVTPAGGVVLTAEKPSKKEGDGKEKVELQLLVAPEPNQNPDQSYHVFPLDPPELVPGILPLSDYTVVQEVDEQHSLLLHPPSASPPRPRPHPIKGSPGLPLNYLAPEPLEQP